MPIEDFPEIELSDQQKLILRRHLVLPDGDNLTGNIHSYSDVSIIEPYDFTHTFAVKPDDDGLNIVEYLHSKFPYRSKLDWQAKIEAGSIECNGRNIDFGTKLVQNDIITHRNIGVKEPSVPGDIRILLNHIEYLIIDKPAPIPMHPGGRYNRNTVVNCLKEKGFDPLFLVHRLDSVTSGAVVLAKNKSTAKKLSELLKSGIGKTYEAIVTGTPDEDTIRINKGIKRKGGYVFECSDDPDSKSAETVFKVLHRGDGWSHVECIPVTGRTHQIRLHLREWGYPVWNDPLYGLGIKLDNYHSVLQRRAISLTSMGFFNPDRA